MGTIKAIETVYKGYRFRSRLEARWAVFFDTAGIKWDYEPEGYDLGEHGYYLPDFFLPYVQYRTAQFDPPVTGVFVEIKPVHNPCADTKNDKYIALHKGTTHPVLLMAGIPTIHGRQEGIRGENGCYDNGCDEDMLLQGRRGRYSFEFDHHKYFNGFCRELAAGVEAAKSARFEHGESPLSRVA